MKLLIAGGGTGGHLFSGVAVAKEFLKTDGNEVLFVGTMRGLEARILPAENLPLKFISIGGLNRMGFLKTIINLLKLPLSILQSFVIVLMFRPDVALGVGGYASGPVMLCAWMLFCPTVIIEQNSLPGVTNRILSKLVKYIVTHFKRSENYFDKNKIRQLGNPVRADIVEQASRQKKEKADGKTNSNINNKTLHIFITGGSQGAGAINKTIKNTLPKLEKLADRLLFTHQTGVADMEMLKQAYKANKLTAHVSAFIDDMTKAYMEADIVICRAGASTISELSIVGKPALFIPLKSAADDHQTFNAKELSDDNAAWLVAEDDFNSDYLLSFITQQLNDPSERILKGKAALKAGKPMAAKNVCELLNELVN